MIQATTKTERIVKELGLQIVSGVYLPSMPLPSEIELCEKFATSRNVMREVIKVLAGKRLIDAKKYRGLFAMSRENWNYLDHDVLQWVLAQGESEDILFSLNEVRALVEPAISGWAAQRASASDLVEIEAALMDMYALSDKDKDAFSEADIRFHRAILLAAHNPVILQLADAISSLQRAIFDSTYLDDKGMMLVTLLHHKNLFEAIRCQNPSAAEACSSIMIERTKQRLYGKFI